MADWVDSYFFPGFIDYSDVAALFERKNVCPEALRKLFEVDDLKAPKSEEKEEATDSSSV